MPTGRFFGQFRTFLHSRTIPKTLAYPPESGVGQFPVRTYPRRFPLSPSRHVIHRTIPRSSVHSPRTIPRTRISAIPRQFPRTFVTDKFHPWKISPRNPKTDISGRQPGHHRKIPSTEPPDIPHQRSCMGLSI